MGVSADIYHAHDDMALPACYIAARFRGKPLILDAHELPLVDPRVTRWRFLSTCAAAVLRALLARCTATITVSPPIVRELQRLYGGPTATLLRNIPDYQRPAPADHLRRHFGLPATTHIALYQGGFQADRSLDLLVRAAPHLAPDHVIVLMGRGDQEAALRELIASLNVADRVFIAPAVSYELLLSWTTSADLGLIVYQPAYSANVRYCLPNKLFEYLMAGLPILTTSLDAVVELIRRYDVGEEIASLEPKTVAGSINGLLGDPARLARMRANALAACQSDLRWDQEQQRLLDLYAHVITPARRLRSAATAASV